MKMYTRESLLPMALECCFGHCEVGTRMVDLVNRVANQAYLQALLELGGSRYSAACSDRGAPKSSPVQAFEIWEPVLRGQ